MKNDELTSGTPLHFEWAVAIFAARESASELILTVDSVIFAALKSTIINVLVNGNDALAKDISEMLRPYQTTGSRSTIRVWTIALGDKAHAWNQYVHHVHPNARVHFFVDGYVCLSPDALGLLDDGLTARPDSLGGTGVPTSGRTASRLRQQMLSQGGMHGNLFALKAQTMHSLRQMHFRLPLGLYRTDSTLGAALAFGLNPSKYEWDIKTRVYVHPEVTWTTSKKKWWRYAEVKSQFKRILRQGQGVLENRAVENFLAFQKHSPEQLPRTAAELVLDWINSHPKEARSLFWQAPLSRLALKKFHLPHDWSKADVLPQLITTV